MNQIEGAKTAPVDGAGSCHLAGTVYVGRILHLPAKRHPRQQRDHLQRPAQIAEIMHFPPRPPLHVVVVGGEDGDGGEAEGEGEEGEDGRLGGGGRLRLGAGAPLLRLLR